MSHEQARRRDQDPAPDAKTAAEEVLDEFEQAQTDPEHRRRADRRRGEAGDALRPGPHAQERAEGE